MCVLEVSRAAVPWSLSADAANTCLHNIVTARYDGPFKPHPSRSAIWHHRHPQLTALFNWHTLELTQNTMTHPYQHSNLESLSLLRTYVMSVRYGALPTVNNYVTFTARCHAWLINSTKLKRSTQCLNISGHVTYSMQCAVNENTQYLSFRFINTLRTGEFKLFKCTFPGSKQFKSTFILCFFKNL